ncbi:MAG: type IV secretory system conjugative DNA transfer family protein [Cyanophyceae cyanobacterium]
MPNSGHLAQAVELPVPDNFQELLNSNSLILLACLIGLGSLSVLGDRRRRQKQANAHFGGKPETAAARRLACAQIRENRRNAVSLYVGRPQTSPSKQTLYLPDLQRGLAVCGGPGSGKTFSIIDPVLRSAVDRGFPIILYDFKYPTQTSRLAAYALKAGYKLHIFAPGFPESAVCNPLDFLRSPTDAEMARQIAEVLNQNFKLMTQGSDDPFFTMAGDQLTEAVFLLAKSTPYPDILMCQALLSLDSLTARLRNAEKLGELNPWVLASFGQLLSVADSEKTVASIIATANNAFTRFAKPSILGAFCGETTLPLDLAGKQLLIVGMDRQRRDVVGPLCASILHMLVNRNVSQPRQDPLVLALDELPTLYLPALVQWLNENREDGLVSILGFQNLNQLEKTYGREIARAILGGCGSKAIFNPQEYESAKLFSDFLGDEELQTHQKTKGRSAGKSNTSMAEQEKIRKLCAPEDLLKFPTGQCLLINPGYQNKQEAGIPLKLRVKVPTADIAAMKDGERLWQEKVHQRLVQRGCQTQPTEGDLLQRQEAARQCLPLQQTEKKLSFSLNQLKSEGLL